MGGAQVTASEAPKPEGRGHNKNVSFFKTMAKSKSGGTRAMIRGRVGSDVYSIGRDAAGKRQQVVRSLAETVANPQTESQMRGRMIMSTIMQAQSALLPIIDHSFDNVSGRQANLSEFIARNYARIKSDVAAHPSSGNIFGLNAYQEKGAKQGAYIISDGKAAFPAAVTFVQGTAVMTILMSGESATIAALKEAWEVGQNGYLTIVGINLNGSADYARLHLNYSLTDSTVITAENIEDVFMISGNANPVVAINGMTISVTLASIAGCGSVIVTRKTNAGFIHSKATLGASVDLPYNANTALPSYPVGEAKFLNGGGAESASSPVTPDPTPTPTPGGDEEVDAHLTSFVVKGANVLTSAVNALIQADNTDVSWTLGIADKVSGKTYALVRKTTGAYTLGEEASDNAVTIDGATRSGTFSANIGETHYFGLTEDGEVIQVLGNVNFAQGSGGADQN